MDGIERLGYELRVYVRVPDLGMNVQFLDSVASAQILMIIYQVMAWTANDKGTGVHL